jgi:hypothetical protein
MSKELYSQWSCPYCFGSFQTPDELRNHLEDEEVQQLQRPLRQSTQPCHQTSKFTMTPTQASFPLATKVYPYPSKVNLSRVLQASCFPSYRPEEAQPRAGDMAFHFVPTGEFPFCPCCPFLFGNSLSLPWRRLQREFLCPNGRSSDSAFMLVDRKGVALCASISRPLRELWPSTKLRFVQIPAFPQNLCDLRSGSSNWSRVIPRF